MQMIRPFAVVVLVSICKEALERAGPALPCHLNDRYVERSAAEMWADAQSVTPGSNTRCLSKASLGKADQKLAFQRSGRRCANTAASWKCAEPWLLQRQFVKSLHCETCE